MRTVLTLLLALVPIGALAWDDAKLSGDLNCTSVEGPYWSAQIRGDTVMLAQGDAGKRALKVIKRFSMGYLNMHGIRIDQGARMIVTPRQEPFYKEDKAGQFDVTIWGDGDWISHGICDRVARPTKSK